MRTECILWGALWSGLAFDSPPSEVQDAISFSTPLSNPATTTPRRANCTAKLTATNFSGCSNQAGKGDITARTDIQVTQLVITFALSLVP